MVSTELSPGQKNGQRQLLQIPSEPRGGTSTEKFDETPLGGTQLRHRLLSSTPMREKRKSVHTGLVI